METADNDGVKEFLEGINRQVEIGRDYRLGEEQATREMEGLIVGHILPHMPRSLHSCYKVDNVSTGYGHPLSHFSLTFKPKVNMHNEEKARIALGTVDKVVAGLEKGRWHITKAPEAVANEYSNDMTIELSAGRTIHPSLIDRMTKKNVAPRTVLVSMFFKGAHETDRCKLVTEEVTVPSHYVEEHTKTVTKVVCDEA